MTNPILAWAVLGTGKSAARIDESLAVGACICRRIVMTNHVPWLTGIIAEAITGKLVELGESTTRPDHIAMRKFTSVVEELGGGDVPGRILVTITPENEDEFSVCVRVTE